MLPLKSGELACRSPADPEFVAVIEEVPGVPDFRALYTNEILRDDEEVRRGFGRTTVPDGVPCRNPAFDVTPADLIAAIITEQGVLRGPRFDLRRALG